MINLAGSKNSDSVIQAELERAGIPAFTGIVEEYGEVKSRTIGLLGGALTPSDIEILTRHPLPVDSYTRHNSFVFRRAWYYYMVDGLVPEETAWKIYNHTVANSDGIRVDGHCGGVQPIKPWITGHKIAGKYCVDLYHIDSQEGLNAFVQILRESGLV